MVIPKLTLPSLLLTLILSCNRHPEPDSAAAGDGGFSGEAPPCSECAKEGDMKLTIVDSSMWVETVPAFQFSHLVAPVGVLPFLKVEALTKSKCKFCHAYSEDGLEFDFGSAHDSLWNAMDSAPELVVLMPGLQFPERDSTLMMQWLDSLRQQSLVDGKGILDFAPWQERGHSRTELRRKVSPAMRSLVSRIGARWSVRSIIIPIRLRVEIDPDAGDEGGYRWQVLWSLWDAQTGTMQALVYANMGIETRGDLPPDRHWSRPFIQWFGTVIVPK